MNDNQQHVETLRRTLQQLEAFAFKNPESKAKLQQALEAAISALENGETEKPQQQTGGGIDLSESVEDTLLRVIEGRPSRTGERKRDAVMHLASLVDQVPQREAVSEPVAALARLVRGE